MIGAIIGDTVGSIYEFDNIKTKDFELIKDGVSPTDDSILTFATADWIMRGGEAWKYYVAYASKYDCPVGGYGGGFTGMSSTPALRDRASPTTVAVTALPCASRR
jgi:ADP-ribosylglycohydrolase